MKPLLISYFASHLCITAGGRDSKTQVLFRGLFVICLWEKKKNKEGLYTEYKLYVLYLLSKEKSKSTVKI